VATSLKTPKRKELTFGTKKVESLSTLRHKDFLKLGNLVVFFISVLYFSIILSCLLVEEFVEDKQNAKILRVILISIFGVTNTSYKNYVLMIGHLSVVVQLGINMIFAHFIAKEHILTCYDEYKNYSLSRMVDRIRGTGQEQGDPSHFLVQEKTTIVNTPEDMHVKSYTHIRKSSRRS
jgi:hypothetical protein